MKVVVDANILFSAVLDRTGAVAKVWFDAEPVFHFIAPAFLLDELSKHHSRVARMLGLDIAQVEAIESLFIEQLELIEEAVVPMEIRAKAANALASIDPQDAPYLALALHFECPIWTGDRKLSNGLRRKDIHIAIDTAIMRTLVEQLKH